MPSSGEVAGAELLTLAPADEFGVVGEVTAHPALPPAHTCLGRALGLGGSRRGGAVLPLANAALDGALLLRRLVPVGVLGRVLGSAGHAREVSRNGVPAVGMLKPAGACGVERAGDVHTHGAAVVEGVLDLDLVRTVGAVDRQHLALVRLAHGALVRGVADDDEVEAGRAQAVGVPLDCGSTDRGTGRHLRVRRHLPRAPALVDERPQPTVGEPFHGALRGLSARVDAEQRRCRHFGDHLPVPVLNSSENPAVRLGDEVDRFLREPIHSARRRRRLGDPAHLLVAQGAELGEAGARTDVVRLGDHVPYLKVDRGRERVDDLLRRAS